MVIRLAHERRRELGLAKKHELAPALEQLRQLVLALEQRRVVGGSDVGRY